EDRMMSWVSVSLAIEILHCVGAGVIAATTAAPPRPCSRRGRIPRARRAPGTVTVPLCSRPNASPFWIMLLLVLGTTDHGIIVMGLRNHNPCVGGSNPSSATNLFNGLASQLCHFLTACQHPVCTRQKKPPSPRSSAPPTPPWTPTL